MAKAIQPITIWYNGENKTGSELNVILSYDNLKDKGIFQYDIKEGVTQQGDYLVGGLSLTNGYINIDGVDYQNWDNSNDAAYQFVASKLNVTLV
jgi:hypothetical protein